MVDPNSIPPAVLPEIPGSAKSRPTPPPVKEITPKKLVSTVMIMLFLYLLLQMFLSAPIAAIFSAISAVMLSIGNYYVAYWFSAAAYSLSIAVGTAGSGAIASWFGQNRLKRCGVRLKEDLLNSNYDKKWIPAGICAGFAFMIGFSLIETGFEYLLSILAGTEVTSGISFEYTGFISEVLIFITVVLVGPVLEELVFRGVICRALTRFGKGFAVVASSLLFALMHLNMTQAVPVFGFALVLGYVYLKTDSLQVPVILHVINNLIAQTSTYLGDTGSTVLTLIEVAVAIAGVILVVMHRKDFKGWSAFTEKGNEGWSALRKSIAFWVFVALFVIASIISFASPSFSL